MEGCIKTRLNEVFREVLPAIYKLVEKYQRHSAYKTAPTISNLFIEDGKDRVLNMEVNYILMSINNVLSKLHKYQELLP